MRKIARQAIVKAAKEFKSPTILAGLNAKTMKGDGTEYRTAIMYLAPFKAAGINVCAMAEMAGCIEACLFTAGLASVYESVNNARMRKTRRYAENRASFMAELVRDCAKFVAWCDALGSKPAVRLNGTSDIQWEVGHPCERNGIAYESIFAAFPEIQFYDYTKITKRAYRPLPANYHLTLSYSGTNPRFAAMVAQAARDTGCNVAVVYRTKALRDSLIGSGSPDLPLPVANGDLTDMRFLDERGVVVGLYAKGRAKKDSSGFVLDGPVALPVAA